MTTTMSVRMLTDMFLAGEVKSMDMTEQQRRDVHLQVIRIALAAYKWEGRRQRKLKLAILAAA
jgi:hypothetical protein